MNPRLWAVALAALLVIAAGIAAATPKRSASGGITSSSATPVRKDKVVKTDAEWRKLLTPEQFDVLRRAGTERAFTGKYADFHENGTFTCAGCALPLFRSMTKFESGTGWPSFYAPIAKDAVIEKSDRSFGVVRTEVLCARCGGHLGHVFEDGPKPTGLRYCMNSVALNFVAAKP